MIARYTDETAQDLAEDYETLRDKVIDLFNPRDDDVAEIAIMEEALQVAADFIAGQPCTCTPDALDENIYDYPCGRCSALGERGAKREER